MTRTTFTKYFAVYTIAMATIHFTLETLYTVLYGQNWTGLLPDYIAVALMCASGYITFKNPSSIGTLCGAWGFAFCLNYRTWAWRFDAVMDGTATPLVETTMYILAYTMPFTIAAFAISFYLSLPNKHQP